MSKIDRAKAILADVANAETNELAARLVREGICFWAEDPDYPNVVGLVHVGDVNNAAILVHLDEEDFEVAGRYEEESYSGKVTPS